LTSTFDRGGILSMGVPVVLGGVRFASSLPESALEPAAPRLRVVPPDSPVRTGRRVLFVSRRHDALALELERKGAEVIRLLDLSQATRLLANDPVDIVAIDSQLGGALELVRDLKLPKQPEQGTDVWLARALRPTLPVVILPLPGDHQYAVIVRAPHLAYLEQDTRLPLARVILQLNVARLLGHPDRLI
jgi:hypothetical protein